MKKRGRDFGEEKKQSRKKKKKDKLEKSPSTSQIVYGPESPIFVPAITILPYILIPHLLHALLVSSDLYSRCIFLFSFLVKFTHSKLEFNFLKKEITF